MLIFQIIILIYFCIQGIDSLLFYLSMLINLIFSLYDFKKSLKKESFDKIFKFGIILQILSISLLFGLTYEEYLSPSRVEIINEIEEEKIDDLSMNMKIIKVFPRSILIKSELMLDFFDVIENVFYETEVEIEEFGNEMKLKLENLEKMLLVHKILYAFILYLGLMAAFFKIDIKEKF